ncbi:uncharacterized protein EI97DRAFT_371120 [Westerdykella ornata]|uniref:Uncharacterized protein n=1 Tax=Westerdykella ornata TaxID=318751 RepID=A0A6A6JTK7_WESOR|nr:uncharacterized protein EI97DRAFT_371120 [Westerdykella ornata]KAF2279574.1 hypothetical protein EI97DRAFT_371120 [Westerdykella ornata]
MPPRIDQAAMVTEAFFAHFLAYFTSDGDFRDLQNENTWIHHLPRLSTDGTNNALNLALRATATAYCATEVNNPSIMQHAFTLYGEALFAHLKLLSSKPKEYTVHMVSTSVLLSIFEAMHATTTDGYYEHINGAVKMMELAGPNQCYGGVLCQLFFHIRTQMAFVNLTSHKSAPVQVRKILVETLEYRRLPVIQQLMDYMAILTELYMRRSNGRSYEQGMDLPAYIHLLSSVNALWAEYQEEAESRGQPLCRLDNVTLDPVFRDAFTALTIAYFCAARVLLAILDPQSMTTRAELTGHCATIISCARYLQTESIGVVYMRMTTPLYLVCLHSPDPLLITETLRMFETWKGGAMKGVTARALEKIYARRNSRTGGH